MEEGMNKTNILEAQSEARRFIKACDKALERLRKDNYDYFIVGTSESGACRRASMDLSRALSKLRDSKL